MPDAPAGAERRDATAAAIVAACETQRLGRVWVEGGGVLHLAYDRA